MRVSGELRAMRRWLPTTVVLAAAVAEAIGTALEMPLEERKERHGRMFAHLVTNNVDRWAEQFLSALAESRQRPGALRQSYASPIGLTR